MSRNIKDLHPTLQKLADKLIIECEKQGIKIKIGECLRTVQEQDELYAKGRTKSGIIVTNARGSSYSSMHQWGVAFDFFLNEDVDNDGKTSDDSFNNNTKLFNRVGKIGKSIGLEWGGDWKSIHDLPHFQLKNWGSTTKKLKAKYGYPDKFIKTWTTSRVKVKAAKVKEYVVLKGDTLSGIAYKYNTTVSKLAKLNKIKNANNIYIGQVIRVK